MLSERNASLLRNSHAQAKEWLKNCMGPIPCSRRVARVTGRECKEVPILMVRFEGGVFRE